jgi:hypothetical protein
MDRDTFAFDRRHLPRRPVSGHAMAVFTTSNGVGKLSRVQLLDASWAGIGVKTSVPVQPGATCSLTPEDSMWPRQIGIVVRCDEIEGGYHVGLQSRLAKAAA